MIMDKISFVRKINKLVGKKDGDICFMHAKIRTQIMYYGTKVRVIRTCADCSLELSDKTYSAGNRRDK